MSTHLEYPNNIETMLETLYEYLEDVSFLRKSLNLTKTSPDCDSARSDFQDSVLRYIYKGEKGSLIRALVQHLG